MESDTREEAQQPMTPGEEGTAPEAPAARPETQPAVPEAPAGFYITGRQLLIGSAAVLTIILLILIILFLLSRRENPFATTSEATAAGIQAQLVISGPGRGAKPSFVRPMAAAFSPDARQIYVADTENNRICVFDARGGFVREFGEFGIAKPLPGAQATWSPGKLNYPVDVAVDDRGDVYVADFYNDSISVFSDEGEFLRRFPDPNKRVGKGGSGANGLGIAVTSVAVFGDEVYATDSYQVVVFSRDGKFLRQFGKPGAGLGELDRPNGITVTPEREVVVSDSNNNRLQAFSLFGKPLWVAGAKLPVEKKSTSEKELVLPRGLTVREDSELVVADPLAQRLTLASLDGEILESVGERGTKPAQLNFPNDVDWNRGLLVVADRENNRVQVVKLVEK